MFGRTQRSADRPTVRILGTHGIPAGYGGFETAAENVGKYLRDNGWRVVVYCQELGTGPFRYDEWHGIERVTVPIVREGWLGTSTFDLKSIRHAVKHRDVCLTFGYNTAIFNVAQRVMGVPNVINMDGIEWSRSRWGKFRQAILYVNERIACVVGDRLIADHPSIETYLRTKANPAKISTITYGADPVMSAPTTFLDTLGLVPGGYSTVICRPIPENSILEIVSGFSHRERGHKLLVLGTYQPGTDDYHRRVMQAAGPEVIFPGAVYAPESVAALRFHSALYLHGHTVGGTNPSLVEAMAAGDPIIAHDNEYNRWVAGDGAVYFRTVSDVDREVTDLLADPGRRAEMSAASRSRHAEHFTWTHVASQYERLLRQQFDRRTAREVKRLSRRRPDQATSKPGVINSVRGSRWSR